MMTNKEIKLVKSLSQKKFRDETGLFVVEGEKMVAEAVKSGFKVENIYRRDEIGEETMSRISHLSSPSPVLAVVRQPSHENILTAPSAGLYIGLDSIRDPGNLGTIIRTADWFGIKRIYVSQDTVELYNPKTVQATMGAVFRVEVVYCDLVEACRAFASAGGKVYGTFLDGRNIYESPLETGAKSPVMIVIGNEANGISADVGAEVSDRLLIPSCGCGAESLNAAVAAGIAMAEFRRPTVL